MKRSILYSLFGYGIEHLVWAIESDPERVDRLTTLYQLDLGVVRRVHQENGPACLYLLVEWGREAA